MFAGHVIVGTWVSFTVTVNEQFDVLLLVSVAVQLTVVTPFWKVVPDAGVHTIGVGPSGQLSVAVGVKLTTAVHTFGSVLFVIGAGQVIDGAWVSLTVTVNEHIAVLFEASVAVHVTVVTPFWKVDPDAGTQTTEQPPGGVPCGVLPGVVPPLQGGQLSVTTGSANVTTAVHTLGSVLFVIGPGQVTVGGCVSLIVTVNVQFAVFVDASLTEHVTVVTPFTKVVPDAGEHTGVPTPGQLSVAVAFE
jgi:hypothetical protein